MLTSALNFFKRLFRRRPVLELSYSKISAYSFCPWKYKLIYLDGKKVPPNAHISLGLSIHRTLEDYHKKDGKTLEELLELYNQVWVNEGFHNPQQTMHFYEKGEKMLRQYYEWAKDRKSEIVALEKEFRFILGKRFLRGIIDRIDRLPDGGYEVIDYKTHSEMWERSKIDSDLQLTLYALGCKEVFGFEPASLSYYFLAHNKFVTSSRTRLQEEEAVELFNRVAEKIEREEYVPDPSKCPRCDFRESCGYSTAKSSK